MIQQNQAQLPPDVPESLEGTPPEVPSRPEMVTETETPEAIKEAMARKRVAERFDGVRGRGVEWVRPSDLIARHSAALAGKGIDLQAELARRTRTTATTSARSLSARARALPPLSAFGHRHSPAPSATHPPVGLK